MLVAAHAAGARSHRSDQQEAPLRGRLTGLHSYWVGAYRIIYELRDTRTVRVVAIRHRDQAHKTDPRWRGGHKP